MNKQEPPLHYYCATLGHPGHNQDYTLRAKAVPYPFVVLKPCVLFRSRGSN